jgi:hypothetical protein
MAVQLVVLLVTLLNTIEMALFIISYDLRRQRNYEALYAELKKFNAVKILESLYGFNRFNTNAKNMRAYFQQFVDSDDGLIVMEVSDWSSYNVNGTPNDL